MLPISERLTYRRMTAADLDLVEQLLSDPAVMAHYPRAKTRAECADWIAWNEQGYAADGFGLWLLHEDGVFVGECGLTWQAPDGERDLELGYHLLPEAQGRGLATEAARPVAASLPRTAYAGSSPWSRRPTSRHVGSPSASGSSGIGARRCMTDR